MSDSDLTSADAAPSDSLASDAPVAEPKPASAEGCVNHWLTSEPGMLLQLALNKAIARDPLAQRRLAKLVGRSLLLQLSVPRLQVGIEIVADDAAGAEVGAVALVSAQQLLQPDCEIEGTPSDLLALMLDPQLAFDNRVQLRGNSQLANQLRDIAQQLDLDWGGLLGDRIGDVAAQLVLKLLGQGRAALQESSNNLLDDLDNWLHEELRVQPCAAELDDFYDQIDRLKLDVDRLNARIERLEQQR